LIPLNDNGRYPKGERREAAQKNPAKGVTNVKSQGVYELKPGMFAKYTQVELLK
jgi:hypothetical protein